ncbi:hypothetical protein [Roseateles koreensis]|uniref:Integral membrane protein n=1 Tax=Roseateles koreensis TaxID=2987526 RepID=A0ABT5KT72_9BURK|nr:hypothetical protein [Roseateles koreensis]MDC8785620.1 hypothetical protein [Roseateles koreensis]
MSRKLSLQDLNRVLASLDAPRNGQALYALMSGFCLAGLMLASAESALAKADNLWGVIWGVMALLTALLCVNTTGLLLMDQARGQPVRDVADAFSAAWRTTPRMLLVIVSMLLLASVGVGLLLLCLRAVRLPWVGAPFFALLVPLGVVLLGAVAFSGVVLVGPLTGPSVWTGHGVADTVRMQLRQLRHGPLEAAALMAAALLISGLVSAVVSLIVVSGGRAWAFVVVWWTGIDVPAQQLMAGLFGYGLRSLGAAGAPVSVTPLGMSALVGGGVVFAVALVLPTLVYLRACCAVYLVLQDAAQAEMRAAGAAESRWV